MAQLKVKEIVNYMEGSIRKTRLVISENGKDTEIILEGDGRLKVAVNA